MPAVKRIHREITPLSPEDSFLVFDRVKGFFDYPVHFHPEFELNFISNGQGLRRVVGDSMEEVSDLELVLVGPGLVHGWEQHTCTSEVMREVTVQFPEDLFGNVLLGKSILRPMREMFRKSQHGILFSRATTEALMPRIIKVSRLSGIDYFLELLSILYDLSISRNQRLLSHSTIQLDNFGNSEKLKLLYDYVEANYSKKIALSDVSGLLNMSNVSFNRFIKKHTGKTFVEYVNDLRIGHACRWLIEKDYSISEIAFKCGFNSIANFNRVFRKSKGRTPTKYRHDFSGIKRVL